MTPDSPAARMVIDLAIAQGLSPERAAAVAQEVALAEQKYHKAAADLQHQVTSMMKAWGKKWQLDPPLVQALLLIGGFGGAASGCIAWAGEELARMATNTETPR